MDGHTVESRASICFPAERASDAEYYARCKFYRRVDLETGAVRYQLGYAFIWHTDVVADYRLTMEKDSKVAWLPSLEQIMHEELEATP
jgi:hypothetical protein